MLGYMAMELPGISATVGTEAFFQTSLVDVMEGWGFARQVREVRDDIHSA